MEYFSINYKMNPGKGVLKKAFERKGLGTHFCSIYRGDEEQFSTIIPFTKVGLERHEKCVYVVDENTKEELIQTFKNADINVEHYIETNQLEFLTKEETYLKDGYFAPKKMIDLLQELEKKALAKGYEGLRATGEMTWFYSDMPGVERLIEYEAKLNYFLPESNTVALCQYNEHKFSPEILLDVVHTHPNLLLYGNLHDNPYYIPPDIFLARMRGNIKPDLYEHTIHDIIQRSQLKKERRRIQEEYQTLFNSIRDTVFVHDLENNFLAVNDAAVEHLGYTEEELLSMGPQEIDAPEYAGKVKRRLRKLREKGNLTFESVHITKEGERRPVEINSTLIQYHDKPAVLSVARDIKERKKAEKRSKKLYSLLKSILEITQLIPRESNLQELLENTAEVLFEQRGYLDVSIALEKENEKITPLTHKGGHLRKKWTFKPNSRANAPKCVEELWESKSTKVIESTREYCGACSFCKHPTDHKTILIPLRSEENLVGCMFICVGKKREVDEEELHLLEEVAGDLAFARAKIKAERMLRKSRERFKKLFNSSPDPAFLLNKKGIIEEVNEAIHHSFGYEKAELIGKSFLNAPILSEEDRKRELKKFKKMFQGKPVSPHTVPFKKANGEVRFVEINAKPVEEEGEITGIIGIARDFTERKRAEEKLEALHSWAQRLNKAESRDAIFENTLDAIEELLGFEHVFIDVKKGDELIVKKEKGVKIPEKLRTLPLDGEGIVAKVIRNKELIVANDVQRHPDYIPLTPKISSELAAPIKSDREVLGVVAVESKEKHAFDQTDIKLLEMLASHVAVAIKELQREEQLEFLLTLLRHNLKNQLSVGKGYLQLLGDSSLSKWQKTTLEKSLSASREMDEMLRRIGSLKEIQQKEELQEVSLHTVLTDAIEENRDEAAQNNMEIEYERTSYEVLAGKLLKELFSNLIDNAIHHSDGELLKISTRKEKGKITVSFEDDGSGLPTEIRGGLFRRGVKGKDSSGLGIGMYIVKRIADKYEADIQVGNSKLGGARFDVNLNKA